MFEYSADGERRGFTLLDEWVEPVSFSGQIIPLKANYDVTEMYIKVYSL